MDQSVNLPFFKCLTQHWSKILVVFETGGQLESVTGQHLDGQSSSASSELKLLWQLLPLDAVGDPAERSGSVPKGERGSSIRILSSRCSSFKVLQKKSVKWERGSE